MNAGGGGCYDYDDMPPCRVERCPIVRLHEAHPEDFVPRRKPRTKVELTAELKPDVVRTADTPDGPLAYVACPYCQGSARPTCPACSGSGEVSLLRWHHLKAR